MNTKVNLINASAIIVLIRASQRIPLTDLIDLINDVVQWGPPVSLNGRLYSVSSGVIPATIWQALRELEGWGAGYVTPSENKVYEYLIVDAQILELIIIAIRHLLDDLAGREEREKSLIFPQPHRQLITNRMRKHDNRDGSSFEPR